MKKTIAVIASLDTKEAEVAFIKEKIEGIGYRLLIIDVGVRGKSSILPDISREDVARAGGRDWKIIQNSQKHELISAMTEGAAVLAKDLYAGKRFDGILAIGGVQNSTIGAGAMKALPIGVPKLLVSTVASGRRTFEPLVGTKDIVLMPAVADIAGVNLMTRTILSNAVAALVGMLEYAGSPLDSKGELVIGATLMGITNDGVVQAVRLLEKKGYQVISFHTTGVGGRAMEELITQGTIKAVMDLTLHEITAEMFGGGFSAGADNRLEAACRAGIPQVVAPGGVDFIDYGIHELLPDMDIRKYIMHNANIAHIKLHRDEVIRVGKIIVERLNRNRGPVTVLIPLRGFRQATLPGEPLCDPEVDYALIEVFRDGLKPGIKKVEIDANFNDLTFSKVAAEAMLELLPDQRGS